MKHIGIVGCSYEGAALCFRTICMEGSCTMGEHLHPEVSMHLYPLGTYMNYIDSKNWKEVANLMLLSAKKLADIGADFVICPDNTIHQAFELVASRSPIPWLHIADSVGIEAHDKGFKKLGITGTKYLMCGPVYPQTLKKYGIACHIPESDDRDEINRIIFKELVNGILKSESRIYFNHVVQKLKNDDCDAVVLGCTEIPLLVDPSDCPLPILDSTRLLARAALKRADCSRKT